MGTHLILTEKIGGQLVWMLKQMLSLLAEDSNMMIPITFFHKLMVTGG